jgi:pimeloyl-ACP methyl ester carboxylesterase
MDHLKIKQAHLVGYSMGGIIAANFIVKHPERVLSGTLGGMGWLKEGDVAQWAFGQIAKNNPNAEAFAICGRSLSKLALTEKEIKSIKVPMTVLVGDKDDIIKRLYITDRLDKARPDWTITEIKNGDHLTCVIRTQFRDELVTWLKRNSRSQK